MLDSAGLTALTSNERNRTTDRSYLKDLPEAIKAHPARAGAAKPRGFGISGFELPVPKFQRRPGLELRIVD